jgi:serine protease Do
MRKKYLRLIYFCFAILLLTIIIVVPIHARTVKDVNAIASQVTVLVARGLKKGDIEARREWDPGSGVIIAHQGDTYYVATNTHVVKSPNSKNVWGVLTPDNKVHTVADDGQSIIRFGKYGETIDGYDLALLKFESQDSYQVATIGNSENIQVRSGVLNSGWPQPEDNSTKRQRFYRSGRITKVAAVPITDGGYSVLYSNQTRPGMSGGPVLNSSGELIGIHGRGRAQGNNYCVDPEVSKTSSCGILFTHFIERAKTIGIALQYNQPPIDPKVIAIGKNNLSKSDTIEDIYKIFTIGALRRDAGFGSGGCGSLLLGDRCR